MTRQDEQRYREITSAIAAALGIRYRHVPIVGLAFARGTVGQVRVRVRGSSKVMVSSQNEARIDPIRYPAMVHATTRHGGVGMSFELGCRRSARSEPTPSASIIEVRRGEADIVGSLPPEALAAIVGLLSRYPDAVVRDDRVRLSLSIGGRNAEAIAAVRAMIDVSETLPRRPG